MWLDRISPRLNILWRGEWPPHFVEPERYLYDHELVLVFAGNFTLRIDGETLELKPGDFVLIPPNTRHTSIAHRVPVFRSCLHFDWQAPDRPLRRPVCSYFPKKPTARLVVAKPSFVPVSFVRGTFSTKGAIPALVESIFLNWQSGDSFRRALCRPAFLELLLQLLHPRHQRRRASAHFPHLASAAKDMLDQPLPPGNASVVRLLEPLGYSYPHLCRLFQKSFGLSPLAYLNARRLEVAKTLLRHPRPTIAEIAYESGFRDPGYFSRLFRRQTGMTPMEFRRELKRGRPRRAGTAQR